ncbi:MAG: DUF3050 domain-containing protein [Magnetococcales bacterium]|nr:DUF3050 domain-containing protein [Magnetococcales bacterium]MBF0150936.1 DUF3050 domain-containing protein [Magnetococcales bacterium]MBF0174189.1 DUF3050 domain-containing protein [Magnetococcales bacterium]MBF0631973.1 DUF3050 domain-containing protein [Magnetococcales bacterium]
MPGHLFFEPILPLREQLNHHPVYAAVSRVEDLRLFMEHHIFGVWDFMSLLKMLQEVIAPSHHPWTPRGDPTLRRFVNNIVLEEESDLGLPDHDGNPTYASHFELYALAMDEVGADSRVARELAAAAARWGYVKGRQGLEAQIPRAARMFMDQTFAFIATGKPHVVAAAFALGREHIIPSMFRAFLANSQIEPGQAPVFHYYLERHIHLDEDHHGPLSLRLLETLCEGDPDKIDEAQEAARLAISSRLQFWDGVLAALHSGRGV